MTPQTDTREPDIRETETRETDTRVGHPLPAAFDIGEFKSVMGSFATGIVVVTAAGATGPAGMACQSFVSLSLEPPYVSFCPALTSSSWPLIRAAGRFTVNILAEDQQELCRRFAVTGGDKFAGVDWRPGANGAPVLDGMLAWIECELETELPGGDHTVAVGRVTAAVQARTGTGPLLYFRRGYGQFTAL